MKQDLNNAAVVEQPEPYGTGKVIANLLIEDIMSRRELSELKYGEPLKAFNGRSALIDAYQEAIDLCMYLRQLIEEEGINVQS